MISYIFYKLGMYKPLVTMDKINLLLSGYNRINFYKIYTPINSLYPDIAKYSSALYYFLSNLETKSIFYVRLITKEDYKDVLVYEWYTIEKKIIPSNQVYKDWLLMVRKLIKWFDENSHMLADPVCSVNIRMLAPYVTNLLEMINVLESFL